MRLRKQFCKWTAGFMMTSLVWTGLSFPVMDKAFAAEESAQTSQDGLKTGLVAVGLLALLTHHGSSSSDSAKQSSTPTQPSTGNSTSTTGTTNSTSTGSNSSSFAVAAAEQQAVSLMNADRVANGLKPLQVDSSLTSLAGAYAQDMINRNFFSHNNPEGKSPFDRMNAAGISYRSAGENIAINQSVAAAEKAFMNSPGHRANILNASYTHVGIGVRQSSNGSIYVVQEFVGR